MAEACATAEACKVSRYFVEDLVSGGPADAVAPAVV